jgi:hypothetical protein
MTDKEKQKRIESLKEYLGKIVQFQYRGKVRKFYLAALALPSGTIKADNFTNEEYNGNPFSFRLNHEDYETNTKRDWDGFWTDKIDKLIMP